MNVNAVLVPPAPITEHRVSEGRRPATTSTSHRDATLSEHVRRRLRAGHVVVRAVSDVEVHDGVVVLRGRVRTYHAKQLAQEIAKTVDGVLRVRNQLVVEH